MGVNNKGDAQCTGSTWRPSHQLRSNVIQVLRPSHQRGSNVWGCAIISGSEQGARRGRICMWEDEVCTGVHGGAWGRFSKIHGACMHCTQCSRVAFPCPLEQSCMTTHGGRMAAQVVRVTQVTGACDHIRLRVKLRVRQCMHVTVG